MGQKIKDLKEDLIKELTASKEIQSRLIEALQLQVESLEKTNAAKGKMIEAYEEALTKLGLR